MDPKLSRNMSDLETPGVAVEMTEAEAESYGAFIENAVTEEEADEANVDLNGDLADAG
jgi:hypothetical protein